MKLTLAQAAEVQRAFGSSTVLYECCTPAEIAAEDFNLKVRLDVEDIDVEQCAGREGPGADYRRAKKEWKEARARLLGRLAKLDFLK